MKPMCRRANPDEETTDWRAVCGKTASTVRRAGRARALSDSYAKIKRMVKGWECHYVIRGNVAISFLGRMLMGLY